MTRISLCLFLAASVLVSCSGSPPAASRGIPLEQESNGSYTATPALVISSIPTQAHVQVDMVSPTAIRSPTATFTSTIMPKATIDSPYYNVNDCIPQNTLVQRGTVSQVIDGDTIYVVLEDGIAHSVRYIGMDAPESDQPFSAESSQVNSSLVLNREVILVKDQSEVDQYDRLLRYVIAGNVFINLEMVKRGLARAEKFPPDEACAEIFTAAENDAAATFSGMWAATQTPEATDPQVIILEVNKREEWVDIKNVGDSEVDLAGWNLVSERGHQECPLSGVIKPGETLRIWAMADGQGGFSCEYNNPIWNNSESDPAVLYNAQGVAVSRK